VVEAVAVSTVGRMGSGLTDGMAYISSEALAVLSNMASDQTRQYHPL
jgi:hypothetical protein